MVAGAQRWEPYGFWELRLQRHLQSGERRRSTRVSPSSTCKSLSHCPHQESQSVPEGSSHGLERHVRVTVRPLSHTRR